MDTKTVNTAPGTSRPSGRRPGTGPEIDLKEILIFIWKLRYYIFICAAAAFIGAWIYVRMQTPVYRRTAEVMLSKRESGTSEQSFLAEISGMNASSRMENEMHILKSPRLMSIVVERLGLDVRYYESHVPGMALNSKWARKHLSLKSYEYYKDSPFSLSVGGGASSSPGYVSVEFTGVDESTFILTSLNVGGRQVPIGENAACHYGVSLPYAECSIVINALRPSALVRGARYSAVKSDAYSRGRALAGGLSVAMMPTISGRDARTDILSLSMRDTKTARADDILNTLIDVYNEDSRDFRNASLLATVEFIESRLRSVTAELGDVENTYRRYQESNTLVNFEVQSQMVLSSDMGYENRLIEIGLQQSVLKMIKDYLQEMGDEYRMIPANIGLNDANLSQIISEYNALVIERDRLVIGSSANNPRMLYLDTSLPSMKQSVVMSIRNLEQFYDTQEKSIKNLLKQSKARMSGIPAQQYDLTQIARRQQIIEPLYLLLQQKKEEAQISMYATSDNLRLVEAPYGGGTPISPESSKIILIALIIGCCLPPGISFLMEYFRNTVETKEDVEKVLDYPILASIPDVETPDTLVTSGRRDVKSESFRMLRSNLTYLSGRVLLVTSSVPGEGKSFVSSNLAVSISHTGKKVLLVGFDLRKPRLMKLFPDVRPEKGHSVTHYLIGKAESPSDTIVPSGLPNLDIAFSGSVPPNPSELLSTGRVEELMDHYRKNYDYVVLDSAPMMLVPDSLLLNRYADHTIYVLRAGYTALNTLREIARMFSEKEVRSPKLVINGLDFSSRTVRYGYGYGKYGYGYGYGRYGYGKYGYGKYGYGKYGYGKYGYGYGYGYGQDGASDVEGHRDGHHFTNFLYDMGRIFRKRSK